MQDRYAWQAEMPDGRIITKGADISGAVRVSIVPAGGVLLPRHDLIGIPVVRRFCRGFVRAMGGGAKEYVHCIVTQTFRFYVRSSNGAALVTPVDYELYI